MIEACHGVPVDEMNNLWEKASLPRDPCWNVQMRYQLEPQFL